jgi:hypothetical protein
VVSGFFTIPIKSLQRAGKNSKLVDVNRLESNQTGLGKSEK